MKTFPYLFCFDFDDTACFSSEPSPSGMTVAKAYAGGVRAVFGEKASDVFQESGGLKSRAPIEVVDSLIQLCGLEYLLSNAELYWQKNQRSLNAYVPQGKGSRDDNPTSFMTELLIHAKLHRLHSSFGQRFDDGNEIGEYWPRCCEGFYDFMNSITFRNAGRHPHHPQFIDVAILSSGHDIFIKKCFSQWGLTCPSLKVTDDDMRAISNKAMTLKRKVKPSTFVMATLHGRWFEKVFGRPALTFDDLQIAEEMKKKMVYFGDSYDKDGGLAKNYGIKFLLYDPKRQHPDLNSGNASFGNWTELFDVLAMKGPEGLLRFIRTKQLNGGI